ncbi:MAG TPA: phage tail sheath C-terminal domain-containing protein [Burkholderiaceae bacterium]|nr:phage tail sheath C-terminal domain-containing protein [Burkholderiaceae bacterium]
MSLNPKTPGVYVEEISVFPPSVAEVESAVPAFVGYTQRAMRVVADDLRDKPTVVTSLTEFEQLFGGPPMNPVAVVATRTATGAITVAVTEPPVTHCLYHAMSMFFANGGGKCYVCSVGGLTDAIEVGDFTRGFERIAEEDEPTLLVAPEATRLAADDFRTVATAMLNQCAALGDRFAILDVHGGTAAHDSNAWNTQRDLLVGSALKYGAAYYPFLRTALTHPLSVNAAGVSGGNVAVTGTVAGALDALADTGIANAVRAELNRYRLVLPPSAAVAGIYAQVDTTRGVWKAPANVPVANVIEPAVRLDDRAQEILNVDPTSGKSVNALRAFAGKGTLVWGARTLAGNDNEWRYVSVRRFFNMVEESVKKSTYWAVFEPNDANTWVKVRGMIENYLTQKWREGALAGATPRDAFFVRCGLGQTMNAQDILEGRLNVEIGMAVVRPAEFIILKFSHKLQTS